MRESLGEQLALALKDVFPFEKPRCDALGKGYWGSSALQPRLNRYHLVP